MKRGLPENVIDHSFVHPPSVHDKRMFLLVLPWLFPGFYGDEPFVAFRTYLALAGTCRQLRYWNFLRRWVGWTSPPHLRARLRSHSFACPMTALESFEITHRTRMDLAARLNIPLLNITLQSRWILSALCEGVNENSNFELDVFGTPFFNVLDCEIAVVGRTATCFFANTFAEMVLICYAVCHSAPHPDGNHGYFIMADWKTPNAKGDSLFFLDSEKGNFLRRFLLGRLMRLGVTAPHEIGFTQGSLETTAFAHFAKTCDTSGRRNHLEPQERLDLFVTQWFPTELFPNQLTVYPNSFQIQFEADKNPLPRRLA
jgi:hypothetical protein